MATIDKEQRKYMMARVNEVCRRRFVDADEPKSVTAAKKAIDAAEKIVVAWEKKQQGVRLAMKDKRRKAADKLRMMILVTNKSAEQVAEAVEKFDADFSDGWVEGGPY